MKQLSLRKTGMVIILGMLSAIVLAGCAFSQREGAPETQTEPDGGTGFILTGPGSYDSADTAVIVKIDKGEETITFLNLILGKNYTLQYDGTTVISDKYEQPLSLEQIREGDIVDITFLKSKKQLTTLMLSASGWRNAEVSRYRFNTTAHDVTIGEDIYKITADTQIFSQGEKIELMDINETDILTFQGIDRTVYSIVVEKGHGYLRLTGDENFIGGWIEVGQNIIRPITEDMLLTVPEGSYQVQVSTAGGGGTKSVIINRNEEVSLDISDLKVEAPKYGQVIFAMTPSSATLYVDGNKVDTSAPVELQYGIHQLIARASGYDTLTSYLKVGEEVAGIEIVLEATTTVKDDNDDDDDDGDDDEPSVSGGNNTTITEYYQVYIDAPEGVEVYVDGNYIGISPISFRKVEGPHVITLRRTGYETRSYTIQVDEEDKDVTYSFAELVAN
ncbi:MAG: PEGA domain-containing protein [Lachnospiraceae bacterium]|nr:PEGA domain-containing protein [Lachnospiraceae bacterium]